MHRKYYKYSKQPGNILESVFFGKVLQSWWCLHDRLKVPALKIAKVKVEDFEGSAAYAQE